MKTKILINLKITLKYLFKISIKFIYWLIWDFSCLRAIFRKIFTLSFKEQNNNEEIKPPATFLLWFVGLYIALFGLTSQRYENKFYSAQIKYTTIYHINHSI